MQNEAQNNKVNNQRFNNKANPEIVDATDVETLAERRYLWTARAFAIACAVSFCCNLVLIISIFQLLPLIRYEPYLLTFYAKDNQVVEIIPMPEDMQNRQIITESLVRQYLAMRTTVAGTPEDMRKRWLEPGGPLQEMSDENVYRYFVQNTAHPVIEQMKKLGLNIEIKISNVTEADRNIWRIEYEAQTMTPKQEAPEVSKWVAIMKIAYKPKRVMYKERLKNPLGFTVVAYKTERKQ